MGRLAKRSELSLANGYKAHGIAVLSSGTSLRKPATDPDHKGYSMSDHIAVSLNDGLGTVECAVD